MSPLKLRELEDPIGVGPNGVQYDRAVVPQPPVPTAGGLAEIPFENGRAAPTLAELGSTAAPPSLADVGASQPTSTDDLTGAQLMALVGETPQAPSSNEELAELLRRAALAQLEG